MGPLALADKIGLDVVVSSLEDFEKKLSVRFHPAEKLCELVTKTVNSARRRARRFP
ncbi:MAG: 3-hydroxyacyl-CoA dehydrogenase family protein [Anaerolineae bacterium]